MSRSLKLKSRSDYRLLGKRIASVDNPKIVTGQPLYGMDVQLPGMVYAAIARAPAHPRHGAAAAISMRSSACRA